MFYYLLQIVTNYRIHMVISKKFTGLDGDGTTASPASYSTQINTLQLCQSK